MTRLAPLASVAITLVAVGCGPGDVGVPSSDHDVQLFSKLTSSKGGVKKACAELNTLCSTKSEGCSAYKTFCSGSSSTGGSDAGPSATSASTALQQICKQVALACHAGYQLACSVEKSYCPSGSSGSGSGTDAGAGSRSDGGTSSSAKACCIAAGECLISGRCSKALSACQSSAARAGVYKLVCTTSKLLNQSSPCCVALRKCVKDMSACPAAYKTCVHNAPVSNVSSSLVKSVCSAL